MPEFFKCRLYKRNGLLMLFLSALGVANLTRYMQDGQLSNNLGIIIAFGVMTGIALFMAGYSLQASTLIVDKDWFFIENKTYDKDCILSITITDKYIYIRQKSEKGDSPLLLNRKIFKKREWEDVRKAFEDLSIRLELE